MNKLLNQKVFSTFSKSQNESVRPLGLLQTEMTDVPSLSYTTTSEIPAFSYNAYLKTEKCPPFEHYRKYPLANE